MTLQQVNMMQVNMMTMDKRNFQVLNKVGYTNFVKFLLQKISFKVEQAFEKINKKKKNCLHFGNSNFNIIFSALFH